MFSNKILYILLIILFIIVLGLLFRKHSIQEGMDPSAIAPGGGGPKPYYGRPGVRAIPFYVPLPNEQTVKDMDQTYVDYSGVDTKKLCPSPPGTKCKTYSDCGPAELCIDQAGWFAPSTVQPGSSVCVCSIQNPCLIGENIC